MGTTTIATMDRGSPLATAGLSAMIASISTATSPGLFNPVAAALKREMCQKDDATPLNSPYLHPLQMKNVKVKE